MCADLYATQDDRMAGRREHWRPEGRPVRLMLVTWPTIVFLGASVAAAACLLKPCGEGKATQARETLIGHSGAIKSIAFRPDGTTLSSVAVDGSLMLWDRPTPPGGWLVPQGPGSVRCVAYSPDNLLLAAGSPFATVALLDLLDHKSRSLIDRDAASAGAACLAFAPDGSTLAVGQQDGHVTLWDPATGRKRATLGRHDQFVASLAFAPDGRALASSGGDRAVRIWDLSTSDERFVILSSTSAYAAMTFSSDGRLLVLCDQVSPVVRLWDMSVGRERMPLRGPAGAVMTLAISPDGTTLAAADYKGQITFWDLATLEIRPHRLRHAGVHALAFAPDGLALATGGFDGTIHVWDWPLAPGE
jgi:WD40 repeat protein